MIKKGTRYLLLPLLFISMCVCAGSLFLKSTKVAKSNPSKAAATFKVVKKDKRSKRPFAGSITTFTIPQELSPAVFTQTAPDSYIIGIAVHAGTDITNITPHVVVSVGSTITPFPTDVPTDFTNAPLYIVDPVTTPVKYNVQVFAAHTATACAATPITLSGNTPTPSGTFLWQQRDNNTGVWSDALGANTGPDFYINSPANNTAAPIIYTFRRQITFGGTTYDSYYDLTVNPVIAITGNTITQPPAINSTFCVSGDPGTIQGSTPAGGDGNTQYQWQSSVGGNPFANISGANGRDYAPSTLNVTTKFQRVVTAGNCTPPTTSNQVTITILPAITNNHLFPPSTTTFCGRSIPLIINGSNPPSGGAGSGTFQYQWQSSTDGTNFSDISSGAQSNDYDAPALTQTTYFRRLAKSGACSTWVPSDNVVTIIIQSPLSANNITPTGPTGFCGPGDPAIITGSDITGGDGTPVYKWESSPDGGAYQPVPGAVFRDYDPPSTGTTIYYHRVVTSGSCTTPSISAPIQITVQPVLAGNTITPPANTTFCGPTQPGAIDGSIPTGGSGFYNIVWQSSVNGGPMTDIPGSNVQNYDPGTVTQTTVFQRSITSGNCNTPLVSNQVTIKVQPALSNNTIIPPANATLCASGAPGVINGSPMTGGDGTYTYTWQSSVNGGPMTDIPNSNVQNYDPGVVTQTTVYQRKVTSGFCTTPSTSGQVTVTVQFAITNNSLTAPANAVFCVSGSPGVISGSVPAGGDGANYTYQWQSSVNGQPFIAIPNSNVQNYDPGVVTQTTIFQRAVTSGSCTTPSISSQVSVQIQPALANNTITLPSTASFCQTGDAGTIVGSVATGGDGTILYQWQQSPDNVDAHFTNINGQNAQNFDPPSANTTVFYRRVVTSGACSVPLVSPAIEIHVTPAIVAGSNNINAPLITTFCTSVDPATIIGSLVQGGDGPASIQYQWQLSTDNGATWPNVPGNGNQPDYDPAPITVTTQYRRVVTSGACTTPIPSVQVVTLTIIDSPPNITINPATPICSGEQATLTIASPDAALTYNWYDTPTKDNLLFQGAVFKTLALTGNQTFYAEASNGTCSSPQLASVDVTVNPLPAVPVLADAEPTGCNGSPVMLSVSDPQNGVTYKWYTAARGGTALFTGTEFTTPVLTDNATYYVEANNSSGCVSANRASAVITVAPLPVATAQGASICPGTTAILTANNPDPDQTINWYDAPTGGTPVGTGSTFTTPVLSNTTSYYAEAVNTVSGCISATRAEAKVQMLTPLPAPVVHVTAAAAPDLTFTWVPVDGAVAYQVSTDNGVTFTDPSSGHDGTSHTVTGLQVGQAVTILVRALGNSDCETSPDSQPVMGIAAEPNLDKIYVANAFTPNGDGKNDIVYVHNDNIKTLKFYIYDQWGNMLFQSQSPQKGWDGTYKGKLQPVGVYVYYLEAIMNDGQPVTKKGTITLLR